MKVHYINILLFALPLNILLTLYHEHSKNEPHTTPRHTPKITITRLLCECELYARANYDNDPQMKKVMDNFNKQTQQRFQEYDDRMVEKRKQCKDQCDKVMQKIILKDKLEKQMAEQLTTLETKIDTNDMPTCVCEKSLAHKTEKFCLNCGMNVGGGVTLSSGVLGGISEALISAWRPAAITAAKEAAKDAAMAAGKAAGDAYGKSAVIGALDFYEVDYFFPRIFESIRNMKHYADVTNFYSQIVAQYKQICGGTGTKGAQWSHLNDSFGLVYTDTSALIGDPGVQIPNTINSALEGIKKVADKKAAEATLSKTPAFEKTYMDAVDATYMSSQTAITASIVAIVVIVLIMVIIYKILRYRRKKKMKKKLQYIKLLEE
ncbi:rifin PIR protein, putative [Plasmodium reichenowi]|uniref:Rifin PIR protein, putative n=1 Tax=Plasmodium reichenowi TaxID=5854 RepID=A0A2P9DCK1_PLARE|nr:rifin PIR protein, putative [Plasmodium reichenowi]